MNSQENQPQTPAQAAAASSVPRPAGSATSPASPSATPPSATPPKRRSAPSRGGYRRNSGRKAVTTAYPGDVLISVTTRIPRDLADALERWGSQQVPPFSRSHAILLACKAFKPIADTLRDIRRASPPIGSPALQPPPATPAPPAPPSPPIAPQPPLPDL